MFHMRMMFSSFDVNVVERYPVSRLRFLLRFGLAYFLTLKMEVTCSAETLDLNGIHGVIFQKVGLFRQ
jgi:hypothetical protein